MVFVLTGGQRSERKKWIHTFDGVNAVLFMVALCEYDRVLFEDETSNRIQESIRLFGEIVTNKFLKNTQMFLVFNKMDLFEDKIRKVPLAATFPDYTV